MWYGDNFGRFALLTSCIHGIFRGSSFTRSALTSFVEKIVSLKMPCMQEVRRANLPKLSPYHMMNGFPRTRARSASDRLTRHLSALDRTQQQENLSFLWAVNTRASLGRYFFTDMTKAM